MLLLTMCFPPPGIFLRGLYKVQLQDCTPVPSSAASPTFLCQLSVQHQLAMPQVVQHRAKICRVSVYQIGTSFILEMERERER